MGARASLGLRLAAQRSVPPTRGDDLSGADPAGRAISFALGTLTRTLRLISAEAEHRRANAAWLLARIPERGPISAPRPPIGSEPGYLRFPVIVAAAAQPHFLTDRARFLGVWPGYPRALSELEGFGSRRQDREGATAGAKTLAGGLFTLPTHTLLSPDDLRALAALIEQASVASIPQSQRDAASQDIG